MNEPHCVSFPFIRSLKTGESQCVCTEVKPFEKSVPGMYAQKDTESRVYTHGQSYGRPSDSRTCLNPFLTKMSTASFTTWYGEYAFAKNSFRLGINIGVVINMQ